jgi:hypothetical protein
LFCTEYNEDDEEEENDDDDEVYVFALQHVANFLESLQETKLLHSRFDTMLPALPVRHRLPLCKTADSHTVGPEELCC